MGFEREESQEEHVGPERCCYGESKKHKVGVESSADPSFLPHSFTKQARDLASVPSAR